MPRNTDELIQSLTADLKPVRPLARPWVRAVVWLACSLPYVAVVILMLTPRGDLALLMRDARFLGESAVTLAAAVSAGIAAFTTIVPGYRRRSLALLMIAPAVWLATMTWGCVHDWMASVPGTLDLTVGWRCFPAILVSGSVPVVAIAVLLRRGAPLTPALTLALGGLAAAALGDLGLRFHHGESGLALLVWHVGAVALLLAAGGSAGRYVLRWRAGA